MIWFCPTLPLEIRLTAGFTHALTARLRTADVYENHSDQLSEAQDSVRRHPERT